MMEGPGVYAETELFVFGDVVGWFGFCAAATPICRAPAALLKPTGNSSPFLLPFSPYPGPTFFFILPWISPPLLLISLLEMTSLRGTGYVPTRCSLSSPCRSPSIPV